MQMKLLQLAHYCAARGWAEATSGNFSVRCDHESFFISASGVDKRELRLDQITHVRLDGNVLSGPPPSAETRLHQSLYEQFEHVNAVAHTHSVAATVLSRRLKNQGVLNLHGYEMLKALEGNNTHDITMSIPIVENSQDMNVLSARLQPHLSPRTRAYLVAGHGLTTWATSISALQRHVEALELMFLCEVACVTSM